MRIFLSHFIWIDNSGQITNDSNTIVTPTSKKPTEIALEWNLINCTIYFCHMKILTNKINLQPFQHYHFTKQIRYYSNTISFRVNIFIFIKNSVHYNTSPAILLRVYDTNFTQHTWVQKSLMGLGQQILTLLVHGLLIATIFPTLHGFPQGGEGLYPTWSQNMCSFWKSLHIR